MALAADPAKGREAALDPSIAGALGRIASALERLAPEAMPPVDWLAAPAYVWDGAMARAVMEISAPPLAHLRGIDRQKAQISENIRRFAAGSSGHDMLLWGARGMGKSALVRAAVAQVQAHDDKPLALVQARSDVLASLPDLFGQLGDASRRFILFIDDLGFSDQDGDGPRHLRSVLEGGLEARPANVRLAVTSNRRAIQPRHMAEQDDPVNPRDAADDSLALADRFGIAAGFHACTQEVYLDIVGVYAEAAGLSYERADAIQWAHQRGSRSGRVAWQYVTELAARAGKEIVL